MNVTQLKAKMSIDLNFPISVLPMYRQVETKDDVVTETEWVTCWDSAHRTRFTMHIDLWLAVKANPELTGLAYKLQPQEAKDVIVDGKPAKQEAYMRVIIIKPEHFEGVL